jgi:hypothetical protein
MFVFAFLSVLVSLQFSPYATPLAHSASLSLAIAIVSTLVESLSFAGLDNIFVPYASCFLLYVARDWPELQLLLLSAAVQLLLFVLYFLCRTPAAKQKVK